MKNIIRDFNWQHANEKKNFDKIKDLIKSNLSGKENFLSHRSVKTFSCWIRLSKLESKSADKERGI